MRLLLLILLAITGAAAQAEVTVDDAWVRATPPGARTAALYLTLYNSGPDNALIAARTNVAEETQLHTHLHEQGMMRMQQVALFELPSGQEIELKPGGKHLMLLNLSQTLKPGDSVELVLEFDHSEALEMLVPVRDGRNL